MAQQIRMPNGQLAETGAVKTVTHAAVSVAATEEGTDLLAASTSRCYALFINDSDTDVYLNIGGTPVANTGILLKANGGYYEMSGAFGNLSTLLVKAIHAGTGTKRVLVTSGEGV